MCDVVPVTTTNRHDAVRIAHEVWSRSSLTHIPFNLERSWATVTTMVVNDQWFGRLAYVDGVCVGGIGGYRTDFAFSNACYAQEVVFYVREGTPRRAAVAKKLMQAFVAWCKEHGAALICVGATGNIDNVAADAFYRRVGFRSTGMNYTMTGDNHGQQRR